MTTADRIAKAQTTIKASTDKVWNALTNPEMIKKYMFGTTVVSDWKEGSKIVWKGKILQIEDQKKLQYSHYSPLSGLHDNPQNYHIVTIDLAKKDNETIVTLTQDNNPDEKTKDHSEKNWKMMLASLKKLLEGSSN
jgi:uncharacterized protein YndB with AHSA1/START domain